MPGHTVFQPKLPVSQVWPQIVAWDNLLAAFRQARRGKRQQPEILKFSFNLEYELAELRQSLLDHCYVPGEFRQFYVRDRKLRLISAAPFRDRVVQHALMNLIEPAIDSHFIAASYASRKLKGVHAAVGCYRHWANRHAYALKIDICRYFDSIDHLILKQKLAGLVADTEALWLLHAIIDSSPPPLQAHSVLSAEDDLVDLATRKTGLPLGNLTSQFFGNVYLNDLDHFIKDQLKIPAYLRYVDDMILLADNKAQLWRWCQEIEHYLANERIGIHPRKKVLIPVSAGLDVLGYCVFPAMTRLSRGSGYRFRRKLKRLANGYSQGQLTLTQIKPHVAGWLGHAKQADSLGLRTALLTEVYFSRGNAAERPPGGSGRVVEQQPAELAFG